MAEVIAVVSGKGGVGKSTFCVNIASTLCLIGARVLLVDLNIGYRNLDLLLGCESVYDFGDIAEGRCDYNKAAIDVRNADVQNLHLICCPQNDAGAAQPSILDGITQNMRDAYDYIIIDCMTGSNEWTVRAIALSDLTVVMLTTDVAAVRNTDKLLSVTGSVSKKTVCIFNLIRDARSFKEKIPSVSNIISVPILGIIPYDVNIETSAEKNVPLIAEPVSVKGAYAAYRNIALRLRGRKVSLLSGGANKIIIKA